MKNIALAHIFLFLVLGLHSQEIVEINEGSVSYVTSQNVYVRFESTDNISVGDTLMIVKDGNQVPALIVRNLSSISCVCEPISGVTINVNDSIVAETKSNNDIKGEEKTEVVTPVITTTIVPQVADKDNKEKKDNKQSLSGRLSVASYSNFSNTPGGNSQRMRYTFAMNVNNIADSKFSVESYMSFVHSNKNWDEIKSDVFNGLKIYNLAVRYQPSEGFKIILGRKINHKLSNIGAIDGLQMEKEFGSFSIGAFAGSRPDYRNYGYDFNLFQYGAYVGHALAGKNGNMETTVAFADQENNWNTDRRFVYLQHYNALVKNLYFIGTAELELYQNINGVSSSDVNLTNLYLMLRYRPFRKISFSLSYRSQSSIIYYETYKDFVEQLIDDQNIQGVRFQVTYRPIKYMSIGAKAGYREGRNDPRPSLNYYGYISYSRVPGINAALTLSATYIESNYVKGTVYSLNLSRDIIPGKLYGGFSYRYVDYSFINYESTLVQHVGDVNLSWKIIKKLTLSASYEGIFETDNKYNRLYLNLIKRF